MTPAAAAVLEPAESLAEGVWAPDNDENAAPASFDGQLSLLTSGELEYVGLASFHPVFPGGVPESPRCVKLVVDCSGSMSGDSIAQAKAALCEIISLLKPNDHFNLITFGSGFELLFPKPVIANKKYIRTLPTSSLTLYQMNVISPVSRIVTGDG